MKPWEYVKIIQENKGEFPDDFSEYNPFVINRALSYHADCTMFANDMNKYHGLDSNIQFTYLLNTIRGKKRPYKKWVSSKNDRIVEDVMWYYQYGKDKAEQVLNILSNEQIKKIKTLRGILNE